VGQIDQLHDPDDEHEAQGHQGEQQSQAQPVDDMGQEVEERIHRSISLFRNS